MNKSHVYPTVLVVIAVILAGARMLGVKHIAFQAVAHFFEAFLATSAVYERRIAGHWQNIAVENYAIWHRTRAKFLWWVFGVLAVIETVCFFVGTVKL